jgi:hypothetical protein
MPLRVLELAGDLFGVRRMEWCGESLLAENVGTNRLVGPVYIGLRVILLSQQAVHDARTLGLLRIENGVDLDARLMLEIT